MALFSLREKLLGQATPCSGLHQQIPLAPAWLDSRFLHLMAAIIVKLKQKCRLRWRQ